MPAGREPLVPSPVAGYSAPWSFGGFIDLVVTFGPFELDGPRFELRQRGERLAVQPKVLRLLLFLVEHRQRSVSDEELLAAVWPNETVTHASIKRAVLGARTALGDEGQTFIRTVRGHGYQFVMPVTEARSTTSTPQPTAATADASFIGRASVLADLDASLAAALAGRGQCVVLVGEPGIGKTRMLHELARRAALAGARVSFGRCMEVDGAPAFWPVLQVVRDVLCGRSGEQVRELLGSGAPELVAAFPELAERLPALAHAPAIDSLSSRFRLFESMAAFLARAAAGQPLVLLFDDVQRADQASLRLLVFLVRQLESSRVLILCSARPSDHRDAGVRERIDELLQQSTTHSIALQGFARAEIADYVSLRTGAAVPAHVLEQLHAQTAGNPLFVEEILRGLGTSDSAPAAAHWDGLATIAQRQSLRGAIERHVQRLSEPCRTLLSAASVLGRDFALGMLSQLAARPAPEVMAELAQAVTAGIVQHVSSTACEHRFTHALIRDVLYEAMPVLQRAELHARAGLALEAHGAACDDEKLAQMAEHFALAAPTHDGGRALQYARRAADSAMQRLAYEEAAKHLQRALALLDAGAPDLQARMELLLARGEALTLGGDRAHARADLLRAVTLARTLGASAAIVQAASLVALPRETGAIDPVPVQLLQEALALLPKSDEQVPWLQALLAKSVKYSNRDRERADLVLESLRLSHSVRDDVLRARALRACHEALGEPEYIAESEQIASELSQLAHRRADTSMLLHATCARVQNCVQRGDMGGVDSAIGTLHALAAQARDPFFRWYERSFRSMRAVVAGDLASAETYASEARALGPLVDEDFAFHCYAIQQSVVLRFQGRTEEAEALARAASARLPNLPGWRAALACIEADLGRKEVAKHVLAQLLHDQAAPLRRMSALAPVAELCVRVGEAEDAQRVYQALVPYADHYGATASGLVANGPVSLLLARLALRLRDLDAAQRHCAHGLSAAQAMPSPAFTSIASLTYAYVLARVKTPGAIDQAREHLRRAWTLADACELGAVSTQCRAMGAHLGVSSARPSASN